MMQTAKKAIWTVGGGALALALTFGTAGAQQQQQGRPGGMMMRGMVSGTVAQTDVQNNAVLVQTQQGQRWVHIPQGVTITKRVDVKLDELKEKDTITVAGVPTTIDARSVDVGTQTTQQGAQGAQAQQQQQGRQGWQGMPGMFGAQAMVTGTVTSLNPLVITTADNVKITVTTSQNTKVQRSQQVAVADIAAGEKFFAMGQANDQNVVEARFAGLGEMSGFAGMGGFGFGGRFNGQRGGRFGGPQDGPQGEPPAQPQQ